MQTPAFTTSAIALGVAAVETVVALPGVESACTNPAGRGRQSITRTTGAAGLRLLRGVHAIRLGAGAATGARILADRAGERCNPQSAKNLSAHLGRRRRLFVAARVAQVYARSSYPGTGEYLGSVPVLGGAALWWTPPNESSIRSQLWHIDEEDRNQVKLLVNMTVTGTEAGPFTLLPRELSERIEARVQANRVLGRYRRLGRLPDIEQDPEVIGKTVSLAGGPGSAALVDTCRCLHYGSRGNRTDRVVLMVQYLPFDTPLTSTYAFQRRKPPPQLELDRLQRQVLGVE